MAQRAYLTRDERMAMKEFQGLAKKAANGKIPTTLSPAIELSIQEQVQKDPLQSGEKMFALLAWATGARARELMKLRWKDFHPIPDAQDPVYALTIPNGNAYALKPSREIPLADEFTALLQTRLDHIRSIAGADVCVEDLFICCDETNYTEPGNMEKMLFSAREVLLTAGVSEESLRCVDLCVQFMNETTIRLDEHGVIYLFRRDLAADLSNDGFSNAQISELLDLP